MRSNWQILSLFIEGDEENCSVSTECHVERVCMWNKCKDPCEESENPCGKDARCKTVQHKKVCYCDDNWIGDPMVACTPGDV